MSPGRPCAVLVLAVSCACAGDPDADEGGDGSPFLPRCSRSERIDVEAPGDAAPDSGRYRVATVDGDDVAFRSADTSFTLHVVGMPSGAAAFRVGDELDAQLAYDVTAGLSPYVVLSAPDGTLFFEGGDVWTFDDAPRRITFLRIDKEPACELGDTWANAALHFEVDVPIDLPTGPSAEVEIDGVPFLATTLAAIARTEGTHPPGGSSINGNGFLIRKADP